jgi:hypothetical protein
VLGIDLGGLSRTDAAVKLRAGLAGRAEIAAPVTVRVADQEPKVRPADVGLVVDVDATVDAAAHSAFRFWAATMSTRSRLWTPQGSTPRRCK